MDQVRRVALGSLTMAEDYPSLEWMYQALPWAKIERVRGTDGWALDVWYPDHPRGILEVLERRTKHYVDPFPLPVHRVKVRNAAGSEHDDSTTRLAELWQGLCR